MTALARVERIAAHRYSFFSDWELERPADLVFDVLRDMASYPAWWPDFRAAIPTGDGRGDFALRSKLPLTLKFSLSRDIEDPASRVLRAAAIGDVRGTVEWKLEAAGPAFTIAHFAQHVSLEHRLARLIDPVIRPLLVWNHDASMRSGQAGLTAHLSKFAG